MSTRVAGPAGIRTRTVLLVVAVAVSAFAVTACSAKGVNGERADDRGAAELRNASAQMIRIAWRFQAVENDPGGPTRRVSGSFTPPGPLKLDETPPADVAPGVADPSLLFSSMADVPYVTRSGGGYRFNLDTPAMDALVGGTPGETDSLDGEAFLSKGRLARVRFNAVRGTRHVRADITVSYG